VQNQQAEGKGEILLNRNPIDMNKINCSWFESLKSDPYSTCRLFCFPFAGGSSISFRSWVQLLPNYMDLAIVCLPGRGARNAEKPLDNIHDLADLIAQEIRPHITSSSIFYGHSMGAALAFEVALRVQDAHPVEHLFCGACRAPHLPPDEVIHNLPDSDIIDVLREYGATPEEVLNNNEFMELLLPMLRADFKAIETYHPIAPAKLISPITAFWGQDDHDIGLKQIQPWAVYTTQEFHANEIKGGHFFLETQGSAIISVIDDSIKKSVS